MRNSVSSYCFGHLTMPPFRIFFDTFFQSEKETGVCHCTTAKCILSVSCLLPRSTSKEGSRQKIMGACKNKVKQYVTVRKKKLYSPLIKTFFLASYDLFKFIVHDYGSHKTMFYCIAICGSFVMEFLQRGPKLNRLEGN